ncbi:MAG TPA: protocatechuate 4,5-dioxygenase subunit alpha [Steroidobacteraceae bacterium]|nr:protocatechuate 4,5-dioxygenase subunit alpha [Steroidobacteraceae bacterium]
METNDWATPTFGADLAQRGYALNKMCYSFNHAENRAAFVHDEDAYCARFGLTETQRLAVKHRNVIEMLQAGGNVYYLAKLAGILGLNVQDIGAQQTGMSVEAFKSKLVSAGK